MSHSVETACAAVRQNVLKRAGEAQFATTLAKESGPTTLGKACVVYGEPQRKRARPCPEVDGLFLQPIIVRLDKLARKTSDSGRGF